MKKNRMCEMRVLPLAVWCIFKSPQACVCAHVKQHKSFSHKSVSILHLLSVYAEWRKRVCLFLPLVSLLGKVRSNRACLSISKCRTNYSCAAPPLFWCSRSCLLSGRWQQAREVIASLELAPSEHCHCRSYWLTHESLCGCRLCQGSPSPLTEFLPQFLFQAAERNPAR